jgi:hypothetical protein
LVNRALDVRVELTETESLLELVGADVATELEELVEVGNETDQLPLTTRKVGFEMSRCIRSVRCQLIIAGGCLRLAVLKYLKLTNNALLAPKLSVQSIASVSC